MEIAALSDIHGHLAALDAVLADLSVFLRSVGVTKGMHLLATETVWASLTAGRSNLRELIDTHATPTRSQASQPINLKPTTTPSSR
jgi:hypothetical protein